MNVNNAYIRAGRKSGMLAMLVLLMTQARASEITVTITGVMNGGQDLIPLFNLKNWNGPPFTLVFTIDDTKGRTGLSDYQCKGSGTGIDGRGASSPATAVLTINGVSHEFGKKAAPQSGASRTIASLCSESQMRFWISEGANEYVRDVVNVWLKPATGVRSLTQDPDWRTPFSTTTMEEWSSTSGFAIVRDVSHGAQGKFTVKSVTITSRAGAPKATPPPEKKTEIVTPVSPVLPHPTGPPASRIYVLSEADNYSVSAWSADGQQIGTIKTHIGHASLFTVDQNNKVYIASNLYPGEVSAVEPDGRTGMKFLPGGIVEAMTTANGKLYLLLGGDQRTGSIIREYSPDGKRTGTQINTGVQYGGALTMDAGKMYVAFTPMGMVKAFDASGQVGLTIKGSGLNVPRAIAVGPDGRIYAANASCVSVYLPNGQRADPTIARVIPMSGGSLDSPMGLAVDSSGRIYVSWYSGNIGIYNPDGTQIGPLIRAERRVIGMAVR